MDETRGLTVPPAPLEPVRWCEVKPGDVLVDDDGQETLVERAETGPMRGGGDWTTIWFHIGRALYHRGRPAYGDAFIRPRAATAREEARDG